MSETPPEISSPADPLNDALVAFTGCVGESLNLCSYGLTVGESYVPFDPDPTDECENDEVACEQAWVRVMSIAPTGDIGWSGDCAVVLRVELEVGVLRCFDVPEGGEAPSASEVLVAATQAMEDMQAIYCAAMGCEVWSSIETGQWVPQGPLGGQYGGTWTFTVEL